MLIDNYSPQKNKSINSNALTKDSQAPTFHHRWIKCPTGDISQFVTIPLTDIRNLFDEQLNLAKQTIILFVEYWLLTDKNAALTLQQYEELYITPKGEVFLKKQVIEYAQSQLYNTPRIPKASLSGSEWFNHQNQSTNQIVDNFDNFDTLKVDNFDTLKVDNFDTIVDNFDIDEEPYTPQSIPETPTQPKQQIIGISRQSIRDITGYTYRPIPLWSTSLQPVFIKWQKDLLEDTSDILVVDGSRQMGKSLVTAQLIVEESFIPGADILVGAFLQSTTNVILRYMEKHISSFEQGTFIFKARERFLENTLTWVRIHFRTFSDDAQNILGLTLRLVVIDEAQLIPPNIIDDALEPTLSTTNGRIILIGTAIEDTSSYMYYVIESIENHTNFNLPDLPTARYIRVSVDENPMTHPKKRAQIHARQSEPAIRRQYYNVWGKMEDALFNPKQILLPALHTHIPFPEHATVVLWIDPARTADHSGYSITAVYNNSAVQVESWFVPESIQSSWIYQANFFNTILQRLKETYSNAITVMDVTWVGDWVATIFKQNNFPLTHTIRYTSWTNESQLPSTQANISQQWDYRVGKSALINNFLNFSSSPTYHILKETNWPLLSELRHIQLKETSQWQMGFTSKYHDDVTNATMIALYIVYKRKMLADHHHYDPLTSSQHSKTPSIKDQLNLYEYKPNQPHAQTKSKQRRNWSYF